MKKRNPARYYIYRNLHTNTWSVKHKDKVIDHPKFIVAIGCDLVVHEPGRQRVLDEGRKNVHAFVVCDSYTVRVLPMAVSEIGFEEITYNPYEDRDFKVKSSGKAIKKAQFLCMQDCKVYIDKGLL